MHCIEAPRLLIFLMLLTGNTSAALAQKVPVPAGAFTSEEALAAAVPGLARRLLGLLPEATSDRDLESRFPVEIAAGRHSDAIASIEHLTAMRLAADPVQLNPTFFPYASFAGARIRQERDHIAFDAAFQAEIRQVIGRLGNKEASRAWYIFRGNADRLDGDLRRALDAGKATATSSCPRRSS